MYTVLVLINATDKLWDSNQPPKPDGVQYDNMVRSKPNKRVSLKFDNSFSHPRAGEEAHVTIYTRHACTPTTLLTNMIFLVLPRAYNNAYLHTNNIYHTSTYYTVCNVGNLSNPISSVVGD